ncbi:MAG: hypothetical protein ACI4LI_09525, partial [Candidatus Fimenecus sp.]
YPMSSKSYCYFTPLVLILLDVYPIGNSFRQIYTYINAYQENSEKRELRSNADIRKTRFYFTAQAHIHKKAVKFKR